MKKTIGICGFKNSGKKSFLEYITDSSEPLLNVNKILKINFDSEYDGFDIDDLENIININNDKKEINLKLDLEKLTDCQIIYFPDISSTLDYIIDLNFLFIVKDCTVYDEEENDILKKIYDTILNHSLNLNFINPILILNKYDIIEFYGYDGETIILEDNVDKNMNLIKNNLNLMTFQVSLKKIISNESISGMELKLKELMETSLTLEPIIKYNTFFINNFLLKKGLNDDIFYLFNYINTSHKNILNLTENYLLSSEINYNDLSKFIALIKYFNKKNYYFDNNKEKTIYNIKLFEKYFLDILEKDNTNVTIFLELLLDLMNYCNFSFLKNQKLFINDSIYKIYLEYYNIEKNNSYLIKDNKFIEYELSKISYKNINDNKFISYYDAWMTKNYPLPIEQLNPSEIKEEEFDIVMRILYNSCYLNNKNCNNKWHKPKKSFIKNTEKKTLKWKNKIVYDEILFSKFPPVLFQYLTSHILFKKLQLKKLIG